MTLLFFQSTTIMDSPTNAPKSFPMPLLNGTSYNKANKFASTRRTSVNAKEREKLAASIISSNRRRQPIDLDDEDEIILGQNHDREGIENDNTSTNLDVSARDPRDEAPRAPQLRPSNPITKNPPIDFDGLSWPSQSFALPALGLPIDNIYRSRHEGKERSHTITVK